MIDGFVLTKELVKFVSGKHTWQEAIQISAESLVSNGYIEPKYVDAMIEVVDSYGPYIVIAPNIAMPHARPEAGSIQVGFSVTVFEEAVSFGEDESLDARLFVSLSCTSSDTHLKMMQALVDVLGDDASVEKCLTTKDKETICSLFK